MRTVNWASASVVSGIRWLPYDFIWVWCAVFRVNPEIEWLLMSK